MSERIHEGASFTPGVTVNAIGRHADSEPGSPREIIATGVADEHGRISIAVPDHYRGVELVPEESP